jgi:hypothetical protein
LCIHKKSKDKCKECKGNSVCKHNKIKSGCRECGGSQFCEHNKIKYRCLKCKGSQFCEHNKIKYNCKDCDGVSICIHKKSKRTCIECRGSQICIHEKINSMCIICKPNTKYFCKGCRLFVVTKKTNYLCSYCETNKPSRQKTKEIKLKKWIDDNYQGFVYNKKVNMNETCQTYYPDFLKDCNTFFLVIECDENSHKNYPHTCEKIRENNIVFSLGLPVVFIRYNPDNKYISEKSKYIILKSYIDYYIAKDFCDNEVLYLFYD